MKKKILIFGGIVAFYVAVFTVILLGTLILPSQVYNNKQLLSKELNTANKKNYKKEKQNGITTITCEKMTGMETIWKNNVLENITLQMQYSLHVTSGKAKLVLVQPDNTIVTLTEQESNSIDNQQIDSATMEQKCRLDLKKGRNKIKIVCEKGTAFSLALQFSLAEL
ncbi:MAG: hypothetical protein K1W16_01980 [Lachnospiraceae bacterium]